MAVFIGTRQGISIHALVKRATLVIIALCPLREISIHALVKRATNVSATVSPTAADFNPRPREEGDTPLAEPTSVPISISIHALVKRATANLYNDYLYFEAKYHISDIFPQ